MLNYAIAPEVLAPFVPVGTELDFHHGQTFVSVVGFLFLRTRLLGIPVPFHRNFEEVNLRFYVRHRSAEGWRRGVTFVREIVPRRAIAWVARVFYDEPYLALPMRHNLVHGANGLSAEYQWQREGRWETLALSAAGKSCEAAPDSHEEFITEHYWGYTKRAVGTSEYQVEHPRWCVRSAESWKFDANVATLYGPMFVETLKAEPASAFIAEGSAIQVRPRTARLSQ